MAHEYYHDDAVVEFPQPGERIRGKRNIYELRAHYPAKVTFKIMRIRGEGNLWITELIITYELYDTSWSSSGQCSNYHVVQRGEGRT